MLDVVKSKIFEIVACKNLYFDGKITGLGDAVVKIWGEIGFHSHLLKWPPAPSRKKICDGAIAKYLGS